MDASTDVRDAPAPRGPALVGARQLARVLLAAARGIPRGVVVAAVATAVLVPQLTRPGPEMDEGMVLAYAARILHGAVPYRDFQTFYGPGNLWAVGGAFAVFGSDQLVARVVGLAYVAATVLAVYLLTRRAGTGAAVASVVITLAIASDAGVWPYATRAAVAFLLLSLVVSTRCLDPGRSGDAVRASLAGLLAGWSILCRFDFALPVLLATAAVFVGLTARARRWYTGALVATVLLYTPYLVAAGTTGIRRVLHDLAASSPGRRLPLPAPLSLPAGGLLYGGVIALLVLAVAAVLLWRRSSVHAIPLAAAALAAAGTAPLLLYRADTPHIEPIAVPTFGLLPLAAVALRAQVTRTAFARRAAAVVISFSLVWGIAVLIPAVVIGDAAALTHARAVDVVGHGGRTFVLADRRDAAAAQTVVSAADRLARPGQTLFVGPRDLRRAVYGPTYLYFLLPQLKPASYFMEFNPWTANRPGSGLARELRHADWLILVGKWDRFREPNASTRLGSTAPNRVVGERFCPLLRAGPYLLYEARRGDGSCRAVAAPGTFTR